MNCPRCNTFLQQGVQFCPNCNYQLQQSYYAPPVVGVPESAAKKEIMYRKLLVALAFYAIGDPLFWIVMRKLQYMWGPMSWISTPVHLLSTAIFAAIPLVVGLVLPKTSGLKMLLIILGSIWFLYYFGTRTYEQFSYNPEMYYQF